MSEFTESYKSLRGSLLRATIYTVGHIIISMSVVTYMTDASFFEAGAVALIEPSINGLWFFILDRIWTTRGIV
jgi:uncharacterized membrane protein